MLYTDAALAGLPDPDTQSAFYENVPLKRLVAFGIDFVIIVLLTLMILPFTAFTGLFFFPALISVVSFAYRIITLARRSSTIGMRIMGIEFRTAQGQKFDLGMAALHTTLFTASGVLFLPQVASIVLILTTARKQSLSDVILGTAAINRPSEF